MEINEATASRENANIGILLKFNYNLIKTCHPLEGIFLSSIVLNVFNITPDRLSGGR